jgi:DNA polymerase-3 subunit epsilon
LTGAGFRFHRAAALSLNDGATRYNGVMENQFDFVASDFETGMYAPTSAVSIGLVKFIAGKETDTYYSLLRPPVLYIRPDFTLIHGLTVDDVAGAPAFAELWAPAILPFIAGLPLAAHNAPFDMRVLGALLTSFGLASPALAAFCTLRLARAAWPGLPAYNLPALAAYFDIHYHAHDALDDARTAGKLTLLAGRDLGCASLSELLDKTGQDMMLINCGNCGAGPECDRRAL